MKSVGLNAFPRTLGRRAGAKKLRLSGRIPAVIYGSQNKPQSVEVDAKAFKDVVNKAHSEIMLFDLTVEGDKKSRLALLKEVQQHVLSGQVLHVDLHEVAENEKVTVNIPVEPTGIAAGVKTGGGTLEHVLFKVKARGLAKDLPEVLLVDVSHLEIGQSIHIGDIKAQAGLELVGDKKISVFSVAAPVSEAQEAAVLEGAATTAGEVEMTKEKKEEGAEGAAPAAAAKGAEKAPAAKGAEKAPAAAAPAKGAEKKK
ncbi:MAG: 50S ribosomal protein L25 [Limisphaerales bacterium]